MEKFPQRERAAALTLAPRVSAVVVVRERRSGALAQLFLSLRSAMAEAWIDELIIVDQDNEPEISSQLRALQADRRDVLVLSAEPTLGAAAAANLGARAANGRWLLFLEPSVVLHRNCAERLAKAPDATHATPCVIGGRLTDTTGRDRRAEREGALNAFSSIAVAMDWRAPRRLARKRRTPSSTPMQVAAVSGALMLVQRRDFEDLGGFDENFVTDGADLDFCRRAADAGGSVLFLPSAAGVQFEHRQRRRRQAQGLALFASKSAKTRLEKVFAIFAAPALLVLVALRDAIAGTPPIRD